MFNCSTPNACLRSTIHCLRGSTCTFSCTGTLPLPIDHAIQALTLSTDRLTCNAMAVDCDPSAICKVDCDGYGSCGFIRFTCALTPCPSSPPINLTAPRSSTTLPSGETTPNSTLSCTGVSSCTYDDSYCDPLMRPAYCVASNCTGKCVLPNTINGTVLATNLRMRFLHALRAKGTNAENVLMSYILGGPSLLPSNAFNSPFVGTQVLVPDNDAWDTAPTTPEAVLFAANSMVTERSVPVVVPPKVRPFLTTKKVYLIEYQNALFSDYMVDTFRSATLQRSGFNITNITYDPLTQTLHSEAVGVSVNPALTDALIANGISSVLLDFYVSFFNVPRSCLTLKVNTATRAALNTDLLIQCAEGTLPFPSPPPPLISEDCSLPVPFWDNFDCVSGTWVSTAPQVLITLTQVISTNSTVSHSCAVVLVRPRSSLLIPA